MSLHLKVSSPRASGVLKGGGGGDGFLVKNLQAPMTPVSRVADIEEEEDTQEDTQEDEDAQEEEEEEDRACSP